MILLFYTISQDAAGNKFGGRNPHLYKLCRFFRISAIILIARAYQFLFFKTRALQNHFLLKW